ncbi:hypothetical protein [Vibrio sp. VPAP30]|uniref:hypothetical protein n=1 Tax=Vibrio sp. VPAP30 TaxID=1647102 RepID=UPI00065A3A9C|nr:hypothetical protein [Vibrio sp. VPAP30]KLN66067.1 hypothetical protein ZX61_06710 [Vibrio sp. VPAP30]
MFHWKKEKHPQVKHTIVYFDTDKDTAGRFESRHSTNKRLDIEVCSNISELLSRIDQHPTKPIDLILIDFYSKLPVSQCSEREVESYKSSLEPEKASITEVIMDFQKHKDHINQQIDKVWLREGLNAADTLIDYFEYKQIDDIQIGMYSMLGRRLIASKDASRLQSKGVVWVWKSKDGLLKECANDAHLTTVSEEAVANSEFDSIHSAILSKKLRGIRVSEVIGDLKDARTSHLLTLFALVISLIFNFSNFDFGIGHLDWFGYMSALIVLFVSIKGVYKTLSKLKALSSRNFT